MRANTPTLLSLYEFARILEIDPLHFAGVDYGNSAASHPHCSAQAWIQFAWQFGDRTSRESVAQAIQQAERNMAAYLGFDVLPKWNVQEERQTVQPFNPDNFNFTGRGERGFPAQVRTDRGYVISGGCRKLTAATIVQQELDDHSFVNVFWTDDSYWMKGEVWALVPADTAPCNVHIFYPGHDGDLAWEIRPATVEIVGTTAVISIRRECAVLPSLWDSLDPRAAVGTDDADFLADFDVFIESIDPSCMLTMSWRPGLRTAYFPFGSGCSCGGTNSCEACRVADQQGCFVATDQKLGFIGWQAATWNADTEGFDRARLALYRQPDVLRVSYLAGYQDETKACPRLQMDDRFARAITYYAASLLERPLCACQTDTWRHWREDPGVTGVRGSYWAINSTPLGTRRGAIEAWDTIRNLSLGLSPSGIR